MGLTAAVYHIGGVTVPRAWLSGSHVYDMRWAADRLAKLEPHVAKPLAKTYLSRYAVKPRSAAIWLRNMSDACMQAAERFPVPPHELRNELRRDMIAAEWSGRCQTLLGTMTKNSIPPAADLLDALAGQAKAWHFCPPLPRKPINKEKFKQDVARRKAALLDEAGERAQDMAAVLDKMEETSALDDAEHIFEDRAISIMARLLDESWWRRRIARAWDVYCELIAIFTGQVRKGVSSYASQNARREHLARKTAQQRWAEGREAINEVLGHQVDLLQAINASVANPMIRRCELMVRMRGFEECAKDAGHVGLFLTLTAPSQYHAWKQNKKNGKTYQNDKYNGAEPSQTQRLLCQQWAQCRAALARVGIATYGFRIAEPHHDATPHWHALLFVEPAQVDHFLTLLTFYFTGSDRYELGMPNTPELDYLTNNRVRNKASKARALIDITDKGTIKAIKPRVAWEVIDESKGSATGYIAKYIAKNIDGHRVGWDEEAEEAVETSTTGVAAWASRHRVRQFQQIGGPSVTVWRELRRLRDNVVEWDEVLEAARAAVNGGHWGQFIAVMGGLMVPRKEHTIQLSRRLDEAANKYGEDMQRLLGVMSAAKGKTAQTRVDGWEIVKKGHRCLSGAGVGSRSELPLSGGSRAPRSSVNNCTQGSITEEKGSPLARELTRMGLHADDLTIKLIERGSIVSFDDRYIRLIGDRLVVSHSWPGATAGPNGRTTIGGMARKVAHGPAMLNPIAASMQREADEAERQRVHLLSMRVRSTALTYGDMSFIYQLPVADMELAVNEWQNTVDWMEDAMFFTPSSAQMARFLPSQKLDVKRQVRGNAHAD